MKKTIFYKDSDIRPADSGMIPVEIYKQILDHVPLVCVDLVIVKNDHAFLIKRKNKPAKDIFWVQGGRLNKNESFEQCGIRKAAAELDIPENKIKITRCLGTFSTEFKDSVQGSASHTVNITFQAEIEDIPLGFDRDHSDGKWFNINGELPKELKNSYKHHPYIADLLKLIEPAKELQTASPIKKASNIST